MRLVYLYKVWVFWRKFLLEIPGGAVSLSLQGLGVLEEVLTRDTWRCGYFISTRFGCSGGSSYSRYLEVQLVYLYKVWVFWRKFLLEIPGGAVSLSLQGLGVLERVLTRDTWRCG